MMRRHVRQRIDLAERQSARLEKRTSKDIILQGFGTDAEALVVDARNILQKKENKVTLGARGSRGRSFAK